MNYPTQFKSYLQGKDFSESTQTTYARNVNLFFNRTEVEEIQTTKADILSYLEYLKNTRGQQNHSRKIHLQALQLYFTCLYQNEIIAKNPCLFLKIRGAKPKTLHRTFTAEQLSQIFDWYKVDFKAGGGVIAFINDYIMTSVALAPKAKISYLEYDWALNE